MKSLVSWISAVSACLQLSSASTSSVSLDDVCKASYAKAALPTVPGIGIDASSLSATAVRNYSATGSVMYPDASFDYCNVTFAYSHAGRDDRVLVTYWLPAPARFERRFLATGGGGLAINSGAQSVAGGVPYGAVAGLTDGGFGGFDRQFDTAFLRANGSVDWEAVHLFGYEAMHEMTTVGKLFARAFFNVSASDRLYAYYQGCSEGGREGWSQVQRYRDLFDGVIAGAPALRYSFQQVNLLHANVVEQTLGYYPPPCELEKIVNLTIAACDPMDGLTDGVVARTDLCKLNFNTSSMIGQSYYCPASSSSSSSSSGAGPGAGSSSPTPAQNGTITARGVAVADAIIRGLRDSQGRQVYLSYQPAASFATAQTQYSNASRSWQLAINGLGGEWVSRFLDLQNSSTLPSLANVTYDTLKHWMINGLQRYQDTLQTTWPDLSEFRSGGGGSSSSSSDNSNSSSSGGGGKVLHYHGESDNSIPTASSVRYFESVRATMYPGLSYNASVAALGSWYRLFLVPGAAHCSTNPALQPNAPFPQTNLQVMIDWVERGVQPVTLNATVLAPGSADRGRNWQICAWPLRPLWAGANATMQCVYDQKSIDTWHYDFNGVPVPVY